MTANEIVLGIDFGTSYSTAAAYINGGVHAVLGRGGDPCIPSLVHYPAGGAPVVGRSALVRRVTEPHHTIASVKTILGRAADSPEFRRFDAINGVPTRVGRDGKPILQVRGGPRSAADVATTVFQHLKHLAEARFGAGIRYASITVPASADAEVVADTRKAAEGAGLEVLQVIPEPVAGALAYGLDHFDGQRRILAYDFGGGTFDVTVLEQRNGELKTRCLGGDSTLGGDDFDEILAKLASGHAFKLHRADLTRDVVTFSRVLVEAEKVKRALSAKTAVNFHVRDAYTSGGKRHDLLLRLDRSIVEPRWKDLVMRSMKTTAETMVKSRLRPSDIDVVLLVGGTTAIPQIQRRVAMALKRRPTVAADPQTAVAFGAAIAGARVARGRTRTRAA